MLISPDSEKIEKTTSQAPLTAPIAAYIAQGSKLVPIPKELLLGIALADRYVCLIGPPGSGKSHILNKLHQVTDLTPICTSSLIRKSFADSPKILEVMTSGRLVDDAPVITLIRDEIQNSKDNPHGFVLDGFPRTVPQANWFSNFARCNNLPEPIILHLNLDEYTCQQRVEMRASAHNRPEDDLQVFKRRLHEYNLLSAPAVDILRNKGIIIDVDCSGSKEQMWESATNGIIDKIIKTPYTL
jgi:adenylate kinase